MNIQKLELAKIITDGGTESRPLHEQAVSDYAEIYRADPAKLPPLDAFFDGERYWLADGFNRLAAAKSAGLETISVNVQEGGRIEALKHSLGSNDEHGYRRTAEDKRYAVTKALQEFKSHSDRSIAKLCQVSPTLVGQVRQQLTVQMDSSGEADKRIGEDGKSRRVPRRKPAEERGHQHGADDPTGIASEAGQTPSACAPEPDREASPKGVTPESQAEKLDTSIKALDKACLRVVAVATQAMTDHPRCKSQVRTRLNHLRAELDQLTKGSLPQIEGLKRAA